MKLGFYIKIIAFAYVWALGGYNPLGITSNILLDAYKRFVSPLQGRRVCYFVPTCSRYAKEAIEKQGFFLGVIMAADRLQRCNPFLLAYAADFYPREEESRIYDPPERHFLSPCRKQGRLLDEIWRVELDTLRPIATFEPFDLFFADFLFKGEDYSSAIAEYQRAVFFSSDDRIKDYARIMSAECAYQMGNYSRARREIEKIEHKGLRMLARGRLLLGEGKFDSARSQLYYIKDTLIKRTAHFLYGLSYLYEGSFDRALSHFKIRGHPGPGKRIPLLAGLLSLFVPGLGQVYSGRAGDGLTSFLVVGTLGGITYYYGRHNERAKFYAFLSLSSLFHLGNIYGAFIAARDYNIRERRRFISRMEGILGGKERRIDPKEVLLR